MPDKINYPMGSVSHATMRNEDLIPAFCNALEDLARQPGILPAKRRKAHLKLVAEIEDRMAGESYADSKMLTAGRSGRESDADDDLEALFDALDAYAAPYFSFGAHPGDGSDYGFWLSESWDEDFLTAEAWQACEDYDTARGIGGCNGSRIKVSDLSEIPAKYRGEVAHVNDHGNVTLYVKTARTLREIWGVV